MGDLFGSDDECQDFGFGGGYATMASPPTEYFDDSGASEDDGEYSHCESDNDYNEDYANESGAGAGSQLDDNDVDDISDISFDEEEEGRATDPIDYVNGKMDQMKLSKALSSEDLGSAIGSPSHSQTFEDIMDIDTATLEAGGAVDVEQTKASGFRRLTRSMTRQSQSTASVLPMRRKSILDPRKGIPKPKRARKSVRFVVSDSVDSGSGSSPSIETTTKCTNPNQKLQASTSSESSSSSTDSDDDYSIVSNSIKPKRKSSINRKSRVLILSSSESSSTDSDDSSNNKNNQERTWAGKVRTLSDSSTDSDSDTNCTGPVPMVSRRKVLQANRKRKPKPKLDSNGKHRGIATTDSRMKSRASRSRATKKYPISIVQCMRSGVMRPQTLKRFFEQNLWAQRNGIAFDPIKKYPFKYGPVCETY